MPSHPPFSHTHLTVPNKACCAFNPTSSRPGGGIVSVRGAEQSREISIIPDVGPRCCHSCLLFPGSSLTGRF